MTGYRKLGRPTDQRLAMLKNMVTTLIETGKLTTTVARAKEVRSIAEKIITLAVREVDNVGSRQVTQSRAKLDSKGKKVTRTVTRIKTTKKGLEKEVKYEVVERELKTEMVTVDHPSRLQARREAVRWIRRTKDEKGNNRNVVNHLFNEIAPRYKDRNGGYTRIYKIGQRRGDGAEMALIQLV
jgi:large subunit ribosomal protein L17